MPSPASPLPLRPREPVVPVRRDPVEPPPPPLRLREPPPLPPVRPLARMPPLPPRPREAPPPLLLPRLPPPPPPLRLPPPPELPRDLAMADLLVKRLRRDLESDARVGAASAVPCGFRREKINPSRAITTRAAGGRGRSRRWRAAPARPCWARGSGR